MLLMEEAGRQAEAEAIAAAVAQGALLKRPPQVDVSSLPHFRYSQIKVRVESVDLPVAQELPAMQRAFVFFTPLVG